MNSQNAALTQSSRKPGVWQKHLQRIEESGVRTVRELATALRTAETGGSGIQGISGTDAAEMLIDIGLSALPASVGLLFRESLVKTFRGSPRKVNLYSIRLALARIGKREKLGQDAQELLADTVDRIKAKRVTDPFKVTTPPLEHPLMDGIYRQSTIGEVAVTLGISEGKAKFLSEQYPSPRLLISSQAGEVSAATDIPLKKIETVKNALAWMEINGVSAKLASALTAASITPSEMAAMDTRPLRNRIRNTRITVPPEEMRDEFLHKLIEAGRKAVPAIAYFHDVMSFLNLPRKVRNMLRANKIQTFHQLKQTGVITTEIKQGRVDSAVPDRMLPYLRLEKVTYNAQLARALVRANIVSVYQLSKIRFSDFESNYKNQASRTELIEVHRKAVQVAGKTLGAAAWAYLFSRGLGVDEVVHGVAQGRSLANRILEGDLM